MHMRALNSACEYRPCLERVISRISHRFLGSPARCCLQHALCTCVLRSCSLYGHCESFMLLRSCNRSRRVRYRSLLYSSTCSIEPCRSVGAMDGIDVLPKPPAPYMVTLPEKKRFAGVVYQYSPSFTTRRSWFLSIRVTIRLLTGCALFLRCGQSHPIHK